MKKILLSLVAFFCVCLLSGCGGKTLTCSNTEAEEGMTSKIEYKVSFDGDEATKISTKMEMEIPEEYIEYMSMIEEEMKSTFEGKNGVDYDIKTSSNKLTLNLVMEPKKMDDGALKEMDLDLEDFKANYDTIKTEMEKEGYTCK